MRHVPGFDQEWRGYERQDKDSGSPIRSGMTDKDKERTQRHEMARVQETRQRQRLGPPHPGPLPEGEGKRHWSPDQVGDDRQR